MFFSTMCDYYYSLHPELTDADGILQKKSSRIILDQTSSPRQVGDTFANALPLASSLALLRLAIAALISARRQRTPLFSLPSHRRASLHLPTTIPSPEKVGSFGPIRC
jgi:hypothetical protein